MNNKLVKPAFFDEQYMKKEPELITPAVFTKRRIEDEVIYDEPLVEKISVDSVIDKPNMKIPQEQHNTGEVNCQKISEFGKLDMVKQSSAVNKFAGKTTPYILAQKFIRKVRVLNINGDIYIFNGLCYKKTSSADAKKLLVEFCRPEVKELGSARNVDDALNFVLYERCLVCREENIENKVLTFLNCNLDIVNGKVLPHSPDVLTTHCVQCEWNPNVISPVVFEKFLYNITGGNQGIMQRIYEMIGYILSPDLGGKCFFLLQGCPNSGKSVLSTLVKSFFEPEVCSGMDIHALSQRFAPSQLSGKVVCISPDLPSGVLDAKSVSKLKQFTGNDYICADVKNRAHIQFYNRAKLVLVTNHPLVLKESDEAFWQRAVAIPFEHPVPKEQQEPNLLEKLKSERNAIAMKAICAYFKLRDNNYRFSGEYIVNSASCIYEQQVDSLDIHSAVYAFVRSNYEHDPMSGVFIYDVHKEFEQHFGQVPMGVFSQVFAKFAEELFNAKKTRKRSPYSMNPLSFVSGIRRKE